MRHLMQHEGVGYLADQVGLEGTGRALKGVSEGLDSVDLQTDAIGYIDRGIDDVTGGYTEPFNEETRALQEGVQLGTSFVGGTFSARCKGLIYCW